MVNEQKTMFYCPSVSFVSKVPVPDGPDHRGFLVLWYFVSLVLSLSLLPYWLKHVSFPGSSVPFPSWKDTVAADAPAANVLALVGSCCFGINVALTGSIVGISENCYHDDDESVNWRVFLCSVFYFSFI